MRWLNYQHFFYFWKVARLGSVTQAARELRLAQPTISAQLRSFEEVLGCKLFERQGRGIKLTEHGRLAFKYAEQVFSSGQLFLDVLDGRAEERHRDLKVGLADVVPKTVAYNLLSPALHAKSGVCVHCIEDSTERLLAELALGEVDLVISDRPVPPSVKVKAFNHFVGESGVSFMAASALAKRLRRTFPKSLHRAPLILPNPESALRPELDRWFNECGVEPHCVGVFQDRALMKIAAREGRGVIPVPMVVEQEVRREFELSVVGVAREVKEQVYLISTERRVRNPILAELLQQGQKAMRRFAESQRG